MLVLGLESLVADLGFGLGNQVLELGLENQDLGSCLQSNAV